MYMLNVLQSLYIDTLKFLRSAADLLKTRRLSVTFPTTLATIFKISISIAYGNAYKTKKKKR